MSATIEITKESRMNFDRQMDKLSERSLDAALKGFAKFMQNAKTLAQQKLKSDNHIVYSRLRNSIYIMTGAKISIPDNPPTYKDNRGIGYNAEFDVNLKRDEVAIGTNVEYAENIEFNYDSYLYWGVKNSNPDEMGREIAKRLLKGIK